VGNKLSIGKVAKAAGLSPKAVRYYEERGLLAPRPRTEGGFREYEEADVKRLLFIRRAKELGISLRQISDLLSCWPDTSCAMTRPALKKVMRERLGELDAQIELLSNLRSQLKSELADIDRRPLSDHSQGFCSCLGDVSQMISIQEIGKRKR